MPSAEPSVDTAPFDLSGSGPAAALCLHGLTVAGLRFAVDLDRDETVLEELALGLVILLGVLEVDVRRFDLISHRQEILGLIDIGFDPGDELSLLHVLAFFDGQLDERA